MLLVQSGDFSVGLIEFRSQASHLGVQVQLHLRALRGTGLQLGLMETHSVRWAVMCVRVCVRVCVFVVLSITSSRETLSLRRTFAFFCSCWDSSSEASSIWVLFRFILLSSSLISVSTKFSLSWVISVRVSSSFFSSSDTVAGSGSCRADPERTHEGITF